MTPDALAAALQAGELRPAYLLAGEEALLRDDALARLTRAVLGSAPTDFDRDRLAGDASAAALLDAVDTLPVMAEKRLVILSEPEARRGARSLAEALPEVVARAASASTCVLVVVAQKVDRRARWVKAFGDAVVDCAAPTRVRDLAAFARAEAERQGVTLARGAAEALAERTGPQQLLLRSEIGKLALLAGPGKPVTREHVTAGTVEVAEAPIWDLTDAIGEGRTADALGVLTRLLTAGAPPPVVLGALVSHFRRLLRTGHGAAVPGPPFVRKKLESQAQRYGTRRLRGALDALHQTDLALKGAGALKPELALERLVIALAG